MDTPYPERGELLREIRVHLEELFQDLRSRGLEPSEARAEAVARFSGHEEFVHAMNALHQTRVRRALDGLPRSVSLGIEYSIIGAIGVLIVFFTILREAIMVEFIVSGGLLLNPISLAGAAILVLGLERMYSLFVKRDHSPENLARRLLSLRYLAAFCVLAGILGTLMGFYTAPPAVLIEQGERYLLEVVRLSIASTIWGGTMALIALGFLFVVEAKVAQIRGVLNRA